MKSKKTLALLKVESWLRGLVPVAGEAKLKVRVCQPEPEVVASASTVLVESAESSSFRRTVLPSAGAHTRMVTLWADGVMSSPAGRLRKVTPAQGWAPVALTNSMAEPEPPSGAEDFTAAWAPSKGVRA